ncbi:hypothetical protein ACFQH6_09550 [Halobacteriaceae archaeon GCM10025711]
MVVATQCTESGGLIEATNPNGVPVQVDVEGPDEYERRVTVGPGETATFDGTLSNGEYLVRTFTAEDENVRQVGDGQTVTVDCVVETTTTTTTTTTETPTETPTTTETTATTTTTEPTTTTATTTETPTTTPTTTPTPTTTTTEEPATTTTTMTTTTTTTTTTVVPPEPPVISSVTFCAVPETEDGDVVSIRATEFRDGDPNATIAANWTSDVLITGVVVRTEEGLENFPGGLEGSVTVGDGSPPVPIFQPGPEPACLPGQSPVVTYVREDGEFLTEEEANRSVATGFDGGGQPGAGGAVADATSETRTATGESSGLFDGITSLSMFVALTAIVGLVVHRDEE